MPAFHVGLAVADDLVALFLLGILVDQGDGRAELDRIARKFGHVDNVGARNLVLELGDTPLVKDWASLAA